MSEGLHEKSLEQLLREFETQLTGKSFNELTAIRDEVENESKNGPKSKRPTYLAKCKTVQKIIDNRSSDPDIIRQLNLDSVLGTVSLINFYTNLDGYLNNLPENVAEMTLDDLISQYNDLKKIKKHGETFSSINFISGRLKSLDESLPTKLNNTIGSYDELIIERTEPGRLTQENGNGIGTDNKYRNKNRL